jgi:hypothetical protein
VLKTCLFTYVSASILASKKEGKLNEQLTNTTGFLVVPVDRKFECRLKIM